MSTPEVSVVIPTRDRAGMVREAVDSVLVQQEVPFELIVVDDGSTDGTEAALGERRAFVHYLRDVGRGPAAARNRGASAAHGPWLAFLDSDDTWLPGKLERQMTFHRTHPDVPVSQTEEIWIRNGTRVNPCAHHRKPEGNIFRASLERCLVSPSSVMLRRDLFAKGGGFDESLAACEDYDLWLRLATRVHFGLVRAPLVIKRGGHADQLSRRYWGLDRFRVASLVKLMETETLSDRDRAAAGEVLGRKCEVLANGAARRGRREEAQRYWMLSRLYTGHADGNHAG